MENATTADVNKTYYTPCALDGKDIIAKRNQWAILPDIECERGGVIQGGVGDIRGNARDEFLPEMGGMARNTGSGEERDRNEESKTSSNTAEFGFSPETDFEPLMDISRK